MDMQADKRGRKGRRERYVENGDPARARGRGRKRDTHRERDGNGDWANFQTSAISAIVCRNKEEWWSDVITSH